ncbi:MAG: adenine deaminase [Ginsengibacter sp.]
MNFTIKGNIVDIPSKNIYYGEIEVSNGKIKTIMPAAADEANSNFIMPGFIDAHVHIESSMLVPSEFARLAVVHGTVATLSDPHEIANVCGLPGVEFMIRNGKTVPFKFHFGAPSCVPATNFETAGAALNASAIDELLQKNEIHYLSELMNFPGVLHDDPEVMNKIHSAKKYHKPIDGHAPGLKGEDAKKYVDAGISTDHECFTMEEALEKIKYGMKILIREGSAAKNFETLIPLLHHYPQMIMFCSDDKHPDSLVQGHVNVLCRRAVAKGIDLFNVLQAACVNPVHHYKLNVGLLKPGDDADFIVVEDTRNFNVIQTYINGEMVAAKGESKITSRVDTPGEFINHFNCNKKIVEDFAYSAGPGTKEMTVIEALEGQLITNKLVAQQTLINGKIESDILNDILKIVVVNRYQDAPVAKAFVKNFGLKRGAIASSVAHDSHNIIAVGTDDESLCKAVNLIIQHRGGISCIGEKELILPLPVAGLMSAEDGYKVADRYTSIDQAAKACGSTLSAPFMTLSFMALLVIPHLKISDLGLFDGDGFKLYKTNYTN